jgi:predicted NUDIX family NTP pyrophosphohydrolase
MPLSAGLVVWRNAAGGRQVLLAHPGGPLWARRDEGAWMIPKGLVEDGEAPLAAAQREFAEETGLSVEGAFAPLKEIRQSGGKRVQAWAIEADLDLAAFAPGRFEMEWPPRSGRRVEVPEVDRIGYFTAEEALRLVLPSQAPLIREALGL